MPGGLDDVQPDALDAWPDRSKSIRPSLTIAYAEQSVQP